VVAAVVAGVPNRLPVAPVVAVPVVVEVPKIEGAAVPVEVVESVLPKMLDVPVCCVVEKLLPKILPPAGVVVAAVPVPPNIDPVAPVAGVVVPNAGVVVAVVGVVEKPLKRLPPAGAAVVGVAAPNAGVVVLVPKMLPVVEGAIEEVIVEEVVKGLVVVVVAGVA